MLFVYHPKILHKYWLQFLLGVKTAPRQTENNAYTKFWGDKQRALWYIMVFSGAVNCNQEPKVPCMQQVSKNEQSNNKLYSSLVSVGSGTLKVSS